MISSASLPMVQCHCVLLGLILHCFLNFPAVAGADKLPEAPLSHNGINDDLLIHPSYHDQTKLPGAKATNGSRKVPELPESPLQLVKPDNTHKKLMLVKENMQYLLTMNEPVAVVAVVGKYHSGKSFLLNQLMGKQTQLGFRVGPSLRPETMGIWMWGKPTHMTLSSGEKVAVIFLDTEGFAANNVSETYDAKVFAVSALLSSYLIYNSVKIIDQADLDYLELLARRTQLFALRSQLSRAKWATDFNHDLLSFPPLLWVVQDFVQSLDADDVASDPVRWLHHLMQSMAWEGNDHRISLLDVFQRVDCKTLFFPATKRDILQDLSKAKENDLTAEYRVERDELIQGLREGLQPKEKNGAPIRGPELASLLDVLVTAANEGSLSQIPSRWSSFIQNLEQSSVEDCLRFYETEMSVLHSQHDNGPINTEELNSWHEQAFNKSVKLLHQVLFGLHDVLEGASQSLMRHMSDKFEHTGELNDKKIRLVCSEVQHRVELIAESALGQLELPQKSKIFSRSFQSVRMECSQSYESQLNRFNTSKHFKDHLDKLQNSLQKLRDSYTLKNNRALETVLLAAQEKALGIYRESTSNTGTTPRTPKELARLRSQGEEKALDCFALEAELADEEPVYKLHSAALKSEMHGVEEANRQKNENLLRAACQLRISEVIGETKENTNSNNMVLPLNETDLNERLGTAVDRAKNRYKDIMAEFLSTPAFQSSLMELERQLQALWVQRRQENVEAYSREVEAPLNTAKKVALLSVDNYDTVFSVTRFIRKVCLLNLNEGKPKHWPSDLKASIIDLFIQSDPDLQRVIKSREGLWSTLVGFIQWIISLFS